MGRTMLRDPDVEDQVRVLWDKKAAICFSSFIYRIKRGRYKQRPEYFTPKTWQNWLFYWERSDIQQKSSQARRNRLSERNELGISKHRGGARCAVEHAISMAKENNTDLNQVSAWDVFLRLHDPKKSGVFIDKKAALVSIRVLKEAEENGDECPDMTSIFLKAVGGISSKKRVFGIGSWSQKYVAEFARLAAAREKYGRDIRVFETSVASAAPANVSEETGDFYEFTADDYYRLLGTKKEVEHLKSKKIRDAELAAQRLRMTKVVIGVRFPDNSTLEASFHPSESIQSLFDLARPDLTFYLSQQAPTPEPTPEAATTTTSPSVVPEQIDRKPSEKKMFKPK